MKKINVLKKRSFYLLGSLFALISSYVIAESNTAATEHDVAKVTIPEAHADVPAADGSWSGDDGGDGN